MSAAHELEAPATPCGALTDAISTDGFFDGKLQLAQFRRGHHRSGTDGVIAAMLAAPIALALAERLHRPVAALDMGAGAGLIGLGLAAVAPAVRVTLAERDPQLAALCAANIVSNDLASRAQALEVDVLARPGEVSARGLTPESQDLVVTNPPWFAAHTVRASPGAGRRAAHVFTARHENAAADGGDGPARQDADEEPPLQTWLRCACRLLRPGGVLVAIHRAEALPELLQGVTRRCGDIRVAPVAARAGAPAIRVVLQATRGRRGPLALDAPLTLHQSDGSFTVASKALHDGAPLEWGAWA